MLNAQHYTFPQKDESIVIRKSDKGSCCVIQDRDDYIIDAEEQLGNLNHYLRLSVPIFGETAKTIRNILENILKDGYINEKQFKYLCPNSQIRQRQMYTLPKIHKNPETEWLVPHKTPKDCPSGWFGPECILTCGQCLGNNTCNGGDGECPLGCEDGWRSPYCKMNCNNNTFGGNCSLACGRCYGEVQCNAITGHCPNGCMTGYSGDQCDYNHTVIVLISRAFIIAGSTAAAIYIIIMALCTAFWVKSRKKMKHELNVEENDASDEPGATPVMFRSKSARGGIFMSHLNSLMTFGQTPQGRKSKIYSGPTYENTGGVNLQTVPMSGASWRDSEFSDRSESNYMNVQSVSVPRTSGGLIYANGILIDDKSAANPRKSCGDFLNEYVNLKTLVEEEEQNTNTDSPIYQNTAL